MVTNRLPKSAIFFALLFMCLATERSAAQQATTTSNAFIAADVQNSSGIITIYLAGTSPKEFLTYLDHSYLTIQVNGSFFTNNPNGPDIVEPSGKQASSSPLFGGSTTLLKGATPGTDTIRTVWQPNGPNAFDIVQEVYPVAGVSSGQIVYKWSIVNREATGLTAQAQLLLDLFTNSPDTANDNPAVTTRDGYNVGQWQDLRYATPYFLTSEYPLCGSNNFPGILGACFTVDDFAPEPMGLLQPSDMAVVDWGTIAPMYLWGFPDSLSGHIMEGHDNAMLFQWPSTGVFGAKPGNPTVQEIGRGSYGTPPCTPITFGSLDGLLLHPDHIKWNGSMYVPNHFPVEAIVWNPNGTYATGAVAMQTITNSMTGQHSGPVQVISPTPIAGGGYLQSHPVLQGGGWVDSLVQGCGASFATWEDTVLASVLTNCTTDSSYDITLSVSAANVQQPIFPFGIPVCPILVDCQGKDITPPRHSQHLFSDTNYCGNPMTVKDSIFDNLATDQGIQSITFTVIPNPAAINVTIPAFSGCPSAVGPITVTQVDTLQAPCVFFTYTDCVGNVSFDTDCFAACAPDSAAIIIAGDLDFGNVPVDSTVCRVLTIYNAGKAILVINLNSLLPDTVNFSFQDSNRLPISILPGDELQMRFCFHPHSIGPLHTIFVWKTNIPTPLTGSNKDTSLLYGNGMESGVDVDQQNSPFALTIAPNPASNSATISLTGTPSANVEIFDVLGREVAGFRMPGSYEWPMGTLPAGTYIVRAASDGTVVSRRAVKE